MDEGCAQLNGIRTRDPVKIAQFIGAHENLPLVCVEKTPEPVCINGNTLIRHNYADGRVMIVLSGDVCGGFTGKRLLESLRWLPADVEPGCAVAEKTGVFVRRLWDVTPPCLSTFTQERRFELRPPAIEYGLRHGCAVIGIQKNMSGARYFLTMHPGAVFRVLRTGGRALKFASWTMRDGPTIAYFDLDQYYSENPAMRDPELQRRAVRLVLDCFSYVMGACGVDVGPDDMAVYRTARENKVSYHIYSTGLCFETFALMRRIVFMTHALADAVCKDLNLIDLAPYCDIGQQFRMGSKWEDEQRKIVRLPELTDITSPRVRGSGTQWPCTMVMPWPMPRGARLVELHRMPAAAQAQIVPYLDSGKATMCKTVRVPRTAHGGCLRETALDALPPTYPRQAFERILALGVGFAWVEQISKEGIPSIKVSITSWTNEHTLYCDKCKRRHGTPSSMYARVYPKYGRTFWSCVAEPAKRRRMQ